MLSSSQPAPQACLSTLPLVDHKDPRDLTAFKYSSIESETNTSMGTMNGGDGSPCFHKSRQFPTNTKIEFHQAVICDLFPLVARGLVKEESNVGGAGVLDRGS